MSKQPNDDYCVSDEYKKTNLVGMTIVLSFGMLILIALIVVSLSSCTLSFTNVMTEGSASDVVDSDPKQDIPVSPTVTLPIKAM